MQKKVNIPVNKAKMVATFGPAINNYDILEEMILSGLDVVRFNFSHGNHEFHKAGFELVRKINDNHNLNIAILADLQGPKIRIGEVENDEIFLEKGQDVILTSKAQVSTSAKLYVSYDALETDVKPNERILINDGRVELKVVEVAKNGVTAKIIEGGKLTAKKGVNFPDTNLTVPSLTEKDRKDLEFIVSQKVNWIALSFVRKAEDLDEIIQALGKQRSYTKIIAKLEKPEAVWNMKSIIKKTDGVMVARGDLGVEIPQERVPIVQKQIIQECIKQAKPVIVATQMMESMIENPVPTRAEINDVANAVIDGADAVMLSGETSVGKYPIKVIKTMQKILTNVERHEDLIYHKDLKANESSDDYLSDAICYNACKVAKSVRAKAIIGMTKSGYTAFMVSSCRPKANIFIFSDNKPLLQTLNLFWGVRAFYYNGNAGTDETINDVVEILKIRGLLVRGDVIVNTASMPLKHKGKTNMIKVSVVKELEA